MEREFQMVAASALEVNAGQVEGLPKNPRLIRDARYESLKRSLGESPEFMELRPVIAVSQGDGKPAVVICGNMRLRACIDLGWEEIPAIVLPSDTPVEKLREYAIKDNVPYGETDWDIVANEWDTSELEGWGFEMPEEYKPEPESELDNVDEDGFTDEEAERVEARVKEGDIWRLGGHRLMCGDCTDGGMVARLMDGQTADLCVTDPPYNVNYEGKVESLLDCDTGGQSRTRKTSEIANDDMGDQDFYTFLLSAHNNMAAVMREGAVIYVFHATTNSHIFIPALRDSGLKFSQFLVWVKNAFAFGRQDYQWRHEGILYGWKEGAGHYFINDRSQDTVMVEDDVDVEKMKKADLVAYVKRMWEMYGERTDVLNENKPLRSDLHPTMKPVRLIGRLIANSSKEGWSVLDPFGGSGTTLIAAEQLHRRCFMMELDPHYCDVIIARWEKLTGKKAVLSKIQ